MVAKAWGNISFITTFYACESGAVTVIMNLYVEESQVKPMTSDQRLSDLVLVGD